MVNYIYSDGLNYFYYDERIVNLSSLLVKKLDVFIGYNVKSFS
jgi:hypothetical protein